MSQNKIIVLPVNNFAVNINYNKGNAQNVYKDIN